MLPFIFLTVAACVAAAATVPDRDAVPAVNNNAHLLPKQANGLPKTFKWTSTGPLIGPKNDSRNLAALKDPSVVEVNGTYHVFASTAQASGYNLVYLNFTDFAKAGDAPLYYLDQTPIGTGYRAAPEVFFFAPQKLWYLIYQNGNAAYSTNPNINNPAGWTAPKTFYPSQPKIIADNIEGGYWVDMWVICDAAKCYLFSSDDNGRLYRSETSLASFPNGMTNTVIALSDPVKYNVFEASCVYTIAGGAKPLYLLLVEAIGANNTRYFRSWTSPSIAGNWTSLADTEANPFAGASNVAFKGEAWTRSISHGELIRNSRGIDQTLTIEPTKLRFLYQGIDPTADTTYNALPWRLALITQTN
ncbi:glycosyl hydrolase family 62-domain-containing protein [Podospora didyma]|uniref:Alpha-L-arabinofuranosidase n=1 Tax=Podospora didyma TaxID=330526 RepID=A0AAE0NI19_9PEZI|nr:glycosyl hydrolase family 62-domain-containing protein [Podospora didyma]